ncbi:MAG: hypothetical protein AAB873_02725 [Patescibacteria group bacterium]
MQFSLKEVLGFSQEEEPDTKEEAMLDLIAIYNKEVNRNNLGRLFVDNDKDLVFPKLQKAITLYLSSGFLTPDDIKESSEIMNFLISKAEEYLKKGKINKFNKLKDIWIQSHLMSKEEVNSLPKIQNAVIENLIVQEMFDIPKKFPDFREKAVKTGVFTENEINNHQRVRSVALQKISFFVKDGVKAFKEDLKRWLDMGVKITQDDMLISTNLKKAIIERLLLIESHGKTTVDSEKSEWQKLTGIDLSQVNI